MLKPEQEIMYGLIKLLSCKSQQTIDIELFNPTKILSAPPYITVCKKFKV